jgi:hypothetical protein
MSARPCQIALHDCIGVDSPITGFSSEDDDPVLFYARCNLFYNPHLPPTLGGGVETRFDYSGLVFAGATQEAADAQAAAQCSPVSPEYIVLRSEAVTVTSSCTINYVLQDFTVSLPAGYITVTVPSEYVTGTPGQTQESVNAEALAVANAMLAAQLAAAGCAEGETFSSAEVTVTGSCSLGNSYLTDDQGNVITDDQGNKIVIAEGTLTSFAVTLPAGYIVGTPEQSQAEVDAAATAAAYAQLAADMTAAGCP